jgi:hypothetical protein
VSIGTILKFRVKHEQWALHNTIPHHVSAKLISTKQQISRCNLNDPDRTALTPTPFAWFD